MAGTITEQEEMMRAGLTIVAGVCLAAACGSKNDSEGGASSAAAEDTVENVADESRRVEVELPDARASLVPPDDWRENKRILRGAGWLAPGDAAEMRVSTLSLETVEERILAMQEPGQHTVGFSRPHHAAAESTPEVLELIENERGKMILRRFDNGTEDDPRDVFELAGYIVEDGGDRVVTYWAFGEPDAEGELLPVIRQSFESLELLSWTE